MITNSNLVQYLTLIKNTLQQLMNILFSENCRTVTMVFIGIPIAAYLLSLFRYDGAGDMVERK